MPVQTRLLLGSLVDGATLTASSAAAALPVTHLQDQFRTRVWRAAGCASEYVDLDFGQARAFNCLALVNHNLTAFGAISLAAGTLAGGDDLKNDTYPAWEPLFGFGEGGFGETGYGGYLTPEEVAAYFPAGTLRVIYFDQVVARFWRVSLADPGNPAGHVEAGRLLLDAYRSSGRGVSEGMENAPRDPSSITYSKGGQPWRDRQTKFREASYRYDQVDPGETWGTWYATVQQLGVGVSFVGDFLAGLGILGGRLHNQLYCHLTEPAAVEVGALCRGSLALSVRESR
ncbi:MAG: hypothetical protein KQJ78_08680 [Deltaproteobacteria bacterium]|nr:hypothetical protein [Deltaproteobacteria bacterium]